MRHVDGPIVTGAERSLFEREVVHAVADAQRPESFHGRLGFRGDRVRPRLECD
jgi:hypothetical protein